MKLIVGLGNPGQEYENTRHNIGFMALDSIAKSYNLNFNKNKFDGLYAETIINQEKVIFLKPQKYMNLSGEVVKKYVDFFKIDINDILIISDDLDMPTGKIKIKLKGSSGGHNGLKNIESNIGTSEYKRIKVGIANNKLIDTKDYVLGKFKDEDLKTIESVMDNFPNMINSYFDYSFDKFMSMYN